MPEPLLLVRFCDGNKILSSSSSIEGSFLFKGSIEEGEVHVDLIRPAFLSAWLIVLTGKAD